MQPNSVIHFVEALKGGPATHLNELLPYQVEVYSRVTVYCPESQAKYITATGVNIKTFPDSTRSVGGVLELRNHWRNHLANYTYEIIHLHGTFAGLVGRTVSRPKCVKKIIYCARGWSFRMQVPPMQRFIFSIVENLLSHQADKIINISQDEQLSAINAGISEHKCELVYNGISDSDWIPLPQAKTIRNLLFIGRYDKQKGLDILLTAMKDLDAKGYTLTTIGSPVLGTSPDMIFPEGVNNLGWKSAAEIRQAILNADAIVMPSRWEGFGFVAAEAIRAGRPVIAAAVGGLPELVIEGETGVLCEPNDVSSLIEAVERLARMDIHKLSRQARDRFEKYFTSERMFNQINRIYLTR